MLANESAAGDKDHSGSRAGDKTRIPVDLAELDRQRVVRGWSKSMLAEAIGVAPVTISEIYRDASTSPETFQKLAAKFAEAAVHEVGRRLMGAA